ncbi:hypothetical protein B0H19DRAFT_1211187 [Mycena capillaripes]|nr:hypothetical protein B0H19DRAFT_1211187 [Mycena capillaripes]
MDGSHKVDPYYGYENIAKQSAEFIRHLFRCAPDLDKSKGPLAHFIAYAFHRTKLHQAVAYSALVLLQRLKVRFPRARGTSGYRLFITAYMLASKVICDDTYSYKSWSIVAQGVFSLREIKTMELEMCTYLDWRLTVDNVEWMELKRMIH